MSTVDATFWAGALVRGPVRRYLEKCEFNGKVKEWRELKGWLRSEFLIKGMTKPEWDALQEWAEQLDNDK